MSQTNKSYRKLFDMLLSNDDLVTKQLIKNIKEEYDKHHQPNFKAIENNILEIKDTKCPNCGSYTFISNGHTKNGTQRYKCLCGKVFSAASNSLFFGTKVNINAWYSFIEGIVSETSTKAACIKAKISYTTGHYWMKKIFKVLEMFQDNIVMSGDIYLDETYVGVEESKEKKIYGKKMRGLSKNKICIVLMNNGEHVLAIKCGFGRPKEKHYYNLCFEHIKEGSTLIHDEEHVHNILIKKLNLKSKAYNAAGGKALKKLAMKELQPINDECRKLKYFLSKHKGIDKDNIQDYLNLYAFITNCKMKDENLYFASNLLLKLLFLADEKIKFRDVIK